MTSAQKTHQQIKQSQQKVKTFLADCKLKKAKKIIISIDQLTHQQVGQILNGGIWQQIKLLNRYFWALAMTIMPFNGIKVWIYRRMGMKIGRNVYIAPIAYLDITHPQLIHIEDNVMIGMGVSIVVHERNMEFLTLAPVHIGQGVCLGGKVLVRCGSRIEAGAQVDAQTAVRGVWKK